MTKNKAINIAGLVVFVALVGIVSRDLIAHKQDVKKWTPTKAVIREVYHEESTKRVMKAGVPQLKTGVRYEYTYGNQTYQGEAEMTDGAARAYANGDQIMVRVNPAKVAESDFDWIGQPGKHPWSVSPP